MTYKFELNQTGTFSRENQTPRLSISHFKCCFKVSDSHIDKDYFSGNGRQSVAAYTAG